MDFVRKTPPSSGQVVDFEQLIRETPPIYGRPEHLESTIFRNKSSDRQQGCLREDLPPSALEGVACEAGGPGPHGGFLLLGMTTSVSGNFRHITDITPTEKFKNCK